MFHYRKTYKRYKSFPKADDCTFCEDDMAAKAVHVTEHAYVIPNRVSYDLWEFHAVTQHLMIVPKRHVHSFAELGPEARLDIMDLMAAYELEGFNVYARAVGSTVRSVQHQHTHLIKTDTRHPRGGLVLRQPYWVVKF